MSSNQHSLYPVVQRILAFTGREDGNLSPGGRPLFKNHRTLSSRSAARFSQSVSRLTILMSLCLGVYSQFRLVLVLSSFYHCVLLLAKLAQPLPTSMLVLKRGASKMAKNMQALVDGDVLSFPSTHYSCGTAAMSFFCRSNFQSF